MMFAIVHPITLLYCLRTKTRSSVWTSFNPIAMMTGYVLFSPKYAYFRCDGNAFNSNSGGTSIEGFVGTVSLWHKSSSNLTYCLGPSNTPSAFTVFS